MNLLFLGNFDDQSYIPYLKGMVGANSVRVLTKPISTIAEVEVYCRNNGITKIFSTNRTLLTKLLGKDGERKAPSLDSYAGSLFKRNGYEYVFVNPLSQLNSITYGKFLFKRYISKLIAPESWFPTINFQWEILDATNADRIFDLYSTATLIAVDIETFKSPLSIRCVGYTAIFIDLYGGITSHSCVIPLDSSYNLSIVRKFNWELKAAKVTQNGKYDNSYLSAYNAPLYNWLWDTATMFHAWYSELPKTLGFIGAFFVREAVYWKDLANTNDLHEYYLYNCRDTWTTAIAALAWFFESPEWAKNNYVMEFPVNYPSHLCEMTGIKRDGARLLETRTALTTKIATTQYSLNTMVGADLNVGSPKQMKSLCKVLGFGKKIGTSYIPVESCDEDHLKKFSFMHPLYARIFNAVLDIRGDRKLMSTYLRTDDDAKANGEGGSKDYKERILYSINPHGTDTGRNASQEHHFWCGFNIQNIPRGKTVKQTAMSDEDFLFAECDLKQAESRDTANISGDSRLLAAVSSQSDFHSINASAFFGVPYRDIYDDILGKVINKLLRDLAKRVNHGANYCMGPDVLVDTMGLEFIYKAQKLLGLNPLWTPRQVAEYLLQCFHSTYPGLEGVMYPGIWNEVLVTGMLVGATGWTRYCFGKPVPGNKMVRNSYVAHVPQSLNAMVLNKAFMRVFYDIAINPLHSRNFKLIAQIHDSILFQFRKGHEYLCEMVKERMEIPVTVKGYDGITRTFTVPADIKAGKDGKGSKYWSDTE